MFVRVEAPGGDDGDTEAGVWSAWQAAAPVVAIVAGIGASLFVILCVAVVVCRRCCVDRGELSTTTAFDRSVRYDTIRRGMLFNVSK